MAKLHNFSITAINLKIEVIGNIASIEADSITLTQNGDVQIVNSKIGENPGSGNAEDSGAVTLKQPPSDHQAGESSEGGEDGASGGGDNGSERSSAVVTGRLPGGVGADLPGSSQPDLHIAISAPEGLADNLADIITDTLCRIVPGLCVDSKGN